MQTSTEQQRVEEIAGRLTPRDREAVLKPAIQWSLGDHLSLALNGLSHDDCLNDIGLLVRAHLQEQAS